MWGTQALRSAYAGLFQLPVIPEVLLGGAHRTGLRLLLELSGLPPSDAQRYAEELDPEALHAALHWYRANSPVQLARAERVRVPTLFLWGHADAALGRRAAESTADFAFGPYLFVELEASHWLVETRASDVIELLQAHLRRHT